MSQENSPFLFTKEDFTPLRFYMRQDRVRQKIKELIESHGGELLNNPPPEDRNELIRLVNGEQKVYLWNEEVFDCRYVEDCVKEHTLLNNLLDYRLNKRTKFKDYEPMDILLGYKTWIDIEVEGERVDGSEFDLDDRRARGKVKDRFNSFKEKNSRLRYTQDEDLEIINYIIKYSYYSHLYGNTIWKHMENNRICKGIRSWQSLKERFQKTILPHIRTYGLDKQTIDMFYQKSSDHASSEERRRSLVTRRTSSDSDTDLDQLVIDETSPKLPSSSTAAADLNQRQPPKAIVAPQQSVAISQIRPLTASAVASPIAGLVSVPVPAPVSSVIMTPGQFSLLGGGRTQSPNNVGGRSRVVGIVNATPPPPPTTPSANFPMSVYGRQAAPDQEIVLPEDLSQMPLPPLERIPTPARQTKKGNSLDGCLVDQNTDPNQLLAVTDPSSAYCTPPRRSRRTEEQRVVEITDMTLNVVTSNAFGASVLAEQHFSGVSPTADMYKTALPPGQKLSDVTGTSGRELPTSAIARQGRLSVEKLRDALCSPSGGLNDPQVEKCRVTPQRTLSIESGEHERLREEILNMDSIRSPFRGSPKIRTFSTDGEKSSSKKRKRLYNVETSKLNEQVQERVRPMVIPSPVMSSLGLKKKLDGSKSTSSVDDADIDNVSSQDFAAGLRPAGNNDSSSENLLTSTQRLDDTPTGLTSTQKSQQAPESEGQAVLRGESLEVGTAEGTFQELNLFLQHSQNNSLEGMQQEDERDKQSPNLLSQNSQQGDDPNEEEVLRPATDVPSNRNVKASQSLAIMAATQQKNFGPETPDHVAITQSCLVAKTTDSERVVPETVHLQAASEAVAVKQSAEQVVKQSAEQVVPVAGRTHSEQTAQVIATEEKEEGDGIIPGSQELIEQFIVGRTKTRSDPPPSGKSQSSPDDPFGSDSDSDKDIFGVKDLIDTYKRSRAKRIGGCIEKISGPSNESKTPQEKSDPGELRDQTDSVEQDKSPLAGIEPAHVDYSDAWVVGESAKAGEAEAVVDRVEDQLPGLLSSQSNEILGEVADDDHVAETDQDGSPDLQRRKRTRGKKFKRIKVNLPYSIGSSCVEFDTGSDVERLNHKRLKKKRVYQRARSSSESSSNEHVLDNPGAARSGQRTGKLPPAGKRNRVVSGERGPMPRIDRTVSGEMSTESRNRSRPVSGDSFTSDGNVQMHAQMLERSPRAGCCQKINTVSGLPMRRRSSAGGQVADSLDEGTVRDTSQDEQAPRGNGLYGGSRSPSHCKKTGGPRGKLYTFEEDKILVSYFLENGGYSQRKGNKIWLELEDLRILPNRPWQSMKERFKVLINKNKLFWHGVSEEQLMLVDNERNESTVADLEEHSDEEEGELRRGRSPYTLKEDKQILSFIVKNKRYNDTGGRAMWQVMEEARVADGRTWQSMKNRFKHQIIRNIENYDLSPNAVATFKRLNKEGDKRKLQRRHKN